MRSSNDHDNRDSMAVKSCDTSRSAVAAESEVIICRDAERVNALVNHPDIRPHVGPGGVLDLSEAVARPENWFLIGKHGGFALVWSAPGVHEVHTFILPEGRGSWAYAAAANMIAFATDNGDTMLWTKIAPAQRHVKVFARHFGMRPVGYEIETFGVPYGIYKMELR